MNAKSKRTLKAAALGAGLIAVLLLPTGCTTTTGFGSGIDVGVNLMPAPGAAHTVVAPPTAD
jgi:hypothetical protein